MRFVGRAVASAIAAAFIALVPAAAGAPPPPENLRVEGGEERWHADNGFRLEWDYPSWLSPGSVSAVRYLVRAADGTVVVPQQQIGRATAVIEDIMVPDSPGAYKAEVWLVDSQGEESPRVAAKLHFDNARPAQLEPLQIPTWLGRAALPYTVRLGYPRDRVPLSGIAGYAVAVDLSPDGDPCAAPSRCTAAETDLHEGLEHNAFAIAGLPEGVAHLHAVAVSGSGMKSASPVHGEVRIDLTDPDTRLLGVAGGWTNEPVTVTALATDAGSGMEALGGGPAPFTAIRIDDGLPRVSPGPSVSATVIGQGAHSISYYARDAAGNVNDGSVSNGVANADPSSAVVRIDRTAPRVTFVNAQAPDRPELVDVGVEDPLSGPAAAPGWVGVRAADSGDRFEELHTEPTPTGFRTRWDSEAYPPGKYEFRAVGYDAAGNAAATVKRADGSSMVLSNPVKGLSVLQAGFDATGPIQGCAKDRRAGHCRRQRGRSPARGLGELVVPFGRAATFGGRLATETGSPLTDREILIVERFGGGPVPAERVSTARTGADGAFRLRLAPGVSREVTAAFAGSPALARSASAPARLAVRTAVNLRTSARVAMVGGAPLIFEGKVAAERNQIPASGKSVQLQFRLPGLPWTEFRTVQTDERGRFRLAYRFADDDSRGVRFRFRAYAPAQDDWPYEPAGSRPVVVRGL